jgi:hypothetical protein
MAGKQDSIVVDGVEWFVGDTVKVVQKVESKHPTGHCGELWTNSWVGGMSGKIGSAASIEYFNGSDGIKISGHYWYPSSSLQNISAEQREAEKKAKEQTVNAKKESIMVNGVEWHIGDRVVWVHGSENVYSISEFRGDNIVLFEGYSYEYPVPSKVFVNVSAQGREQVKEVTPPPTIGGIELKPWMRVETAAGHNYIICFGMQDLFYKDKVHIVRETGFQPLSRNEGDWEVVKVYAAPDYPTLDPNEHGSLLWSKAGDEAKKKEAMTALEEAEVEFEAAKQRYNEAYAKLVAITD